LSHSLISAFPTAVVLEIAVVAAPTLEVVSLGVLLPVVVVEVPVCAALTKQDWCTAVPSILSCFASPVKKNFLQIEHFAAITPSPV